MMVEHDREIPIIEQIEQIIDAPLDHDLIIEVIKQTIVEHEHPKMIALHPICLVAPGSP